MIKYGIDQSICRQVVEIATAAGRAILEVRATLTRDGTGVTYKADHSPLSLADTAAHERIATGLRQLTPHLAFLSEEGGKAYLGERESEAYWLVDPLDGTREFLSGSDEFTVNIALIVEGRPVWGVVGVPAQEQVYWGGYHEGAWCRHGDDVKALRVSPWPQPGERVRIVASKSHMSPETLDFVARFQPHDLIQAGSSLKFCRIAQGQADLYPRLGPTCEWDTAAAQAVLEGAGGQVFDLSGQPLRYGKDTILNPFFVAASVGPHGIILP